MNPFILLAIIVVAILVVCGPRWLRGYRDHERRLASEQEKDLAQAKAAYVADQIDVEEYERVVGILLRPYHRTVLKKGWRVPPIPEPPPPPPPPRNRQNWELLMERANGRRTLAGMGPLLEGVRPEEDDELLEGVRPDPDALEPHWE